MHSIIGVIKGGGGGEGRGPGPSPIKIPPMIKKIVTTLPSDVQLQFFCFSNDAQNNN